jgi:hypothetical protein
MCALVARKLSSLQAVKLVSCQAGKLALNLGRYTVKVVPAPICVEKTN